MLLCSVTKPGQSHVSHWLGLKSKGFVVALLNETKEVSNTVICQSSLWHLGFNYMKNKKP